MEAEFSMPITQIYAKKYKIANKKKKGKILSEYCEAFKVTRNLASKRIRKTIREIYPVALKTSSKIVKKRGSKVK